MPLSEPVLSALHDRLARTQRDARLPALTAAVYRDGAEVFSHRVGEPAPDHRTQFRIGSISKPFTAVLVFQLRDEGRLSLDDPLDAHVQGTAVGDVTLRALLGHTSGLRREPMGDFWEAVPGVPGEELLAGLRAEDVAEAARRRFHYSNVGYALLGQVVERLRGLSWEEAVRRHVLEPLALRDTSFLPRDPHATGYRLHLLQGTLAEEPATDTGAMAPAGQLWSTPADLCRFGCFLAAPAVEVLSAASAEEMATPETLDPEAWADGYGHGLQLWRRGERLYAGHGGSMPGFIAGLVVHRPSRTAAAVMANRWQSVRGTGLAVELLEDVLGGLPAPVAPWTHRPAPPPFADLLGHWWWRGIAQEAVCRDGMLALARVGDDPRWATLFRPTGPDTFVGTSGEDLGEQLTVQRDAAGTATALVAGGWLYTRDPDDPRTV